MHFVASYGRGGDAKILVINCPLFVCSAKYKYIMWSYT